LEKCGINFKNSLQLKPHLCREIMASGTDLEQIAKNLGHHDTAFVTQFRRSAKINEEKKEAVLASEGKRIL